MLLTKLKIGTGIVFVATLIAALGTGMAGAYLASAEQPGQNKTTEKANPTVKGQEGALAAPQRKPTDVGKLLDRLEQLRPQAGQDEWAFALRDLIQLGPPAVPELIAEMDATHDSFMLRCLVFALRGIGDKRAIPGLIRAIPKSCIPPGSDMGYMAKDPDLLAFMQKHEGNPSFSKSHYSFGRPITELRFTLQEMTGQKMGEDEIVSIFLAGEPRQQFLKQSLYQRCAERWSKWWELHHAEYVKEDGYAKVNLPPLAGQSFSEQDFPHGPAVKIGDGASGHILESVRNPRAKNVFLDLDTGRQGALPKQLQGPEDQPERMDNLFALASVFVPLGGLKRSQPERLDDIFAWAAREGFDLMGTEYLVPGDDTPHYVLRGLGLAAWQIETDRWDTLETDLRDAKPLDMGTRTDGLLAKFDAAKGRYEPEGTATFLYKTREGSYGAIFVGVEVHDTDMRERIGRPAGPNINLDPKGFYKGRRFGYMTIVQAVAK